VSLFHWISFLTVISYLFKTSFYTIYKVVFVAAFDYKTPYYILWQQELCRFQKLHARK